MIVFLLLFLQDEDNRKIVETAVETFGGLHVSFINAGVVILSPLADLTEDAIDSAFGPNFKGVAFGLKHQVCKIKTRQSEWGSYGQFK